MPAVMDELSATAEIRLHYSGPDNLFIDRMMLFRIFLNLLRNAQDAGAKQMTIDVWQAGHLAVIDISYNGPGIDNLSANGFFLPLPLAALLISGWDWQFALIWRCP